MNKILILSPLPPPVHGMSLASMMFMRGLKNYNFCQCYHINSATSSDIKSGDEQGKVGLDKLLAYLLNFRFACSKIILARVDVVYIAIPQSILGFISYLPYIIISKLVSSKVVLHFHGSNYDKLFKIKFAGFFLSLFIGRFVDSIIVLGESLRGSFEGHLPHHLLNVCQNGVQHEISSYPFVIKGVTGDKIKLTFLSNLMVSKGILDLLDTFILYPKLFEKYEVNIYGNFDGDAEIVKGKLDELKGSIHFGGPVYSTAKIEAFEKTDVFILPSHNEGQPISILEAYFAGCCVIATSVGGICDIFKNGVNGYTIEVGNPKSIFDCLSTLSHKNVAEMGYRNRELALIKYTEESYVERLFKICKSHFKVKNV